MTEKEAGKEQKSKKRIFDMHQVRYAVATVLLLLTLLVCQSVAIMAKDNWVKVGNLWYWYNDAKTTAAVTTAAADKAETVTKKPGETEEPVVVAEPEDLDEVEEQQQNEKVTEAPVTEEEADDGEQHFDEDGSELL